MALARTGQAFTLPFCFYFIVEDICVLLMRGTSTLELTTASIAVDILKPSLRDGFKISAIPLI